MKKPWDIAKDVIVDLGNGTKVLVLVRARYGEKPVVQARVIQ